MEAAAPRRPSRGAGTSTRRCWPPSRKASSAAAGSTSRAPTRSRSPRASSQRAPATSPCSSCAATTASPRAPQRVPPPRLARLRRRGPSRDAAVPVPRVDVRPRRGAALGAASRPRAGFRGGGSATAATAGRHLGPFVFVNPDAQAPPLPDVLGALPGPPRRGGHRRGRAAVRPSRRGRVQRELEGLLRELPRVLPLPGRPSGVLEGRRRLSGRVPARKRPPGSRASSPLRSARPASSTPAARSNAVSSTSSSRTPRST